MGQTCLPVRSSVTEGLRGRRRGRVSFGSTHGEFIKARNQHESPADALNNVLVAAAFDKVVRK